jgi:hypothetical protein
LHRELRRSRGRRRARYGGDSLACDVGAVRGDAKPTGQRTTRDAPTVRRSSANSLERRTVR